MLISAVEKPAVDRTEGMGIVLQIIFQVSGLILLQNVS